MTRWLLVLGLAGCLRSTLAECEDGWTCPPGARCAAAPTSEVHCMPASCGDGILDDGELCDGDQVGDTDCVGLGYDAGAVRCDANCRYDANACTTLGFAPVYTGSERIGPFCAYDTPAGVVAHVAQSRDVVRVDAAGSSKLPVPPTTAGRITALACVEDRLAAIAIDQLVTYLDGAWTPEPARADNVFWSAVEVEANEKVVALETNTTGPGATLWELSATGWVQPVEVGEPVDLIDVHAGFGFAADSGTMALRIRPAGAWIDAPRPGLQFPQHLWAADDLDQFIATSTGLYRRFPTGVTGWTLVPSISSGPLVGRTVDDLFVLGNDLRLAHFDGSVWSMTSGSFDSLDDAWVAADGTFYASRGAQLVRAHSLWFALARAATQIAVTSSGSVIRFDPFRGVFMLDEQEFNTLGFVDMRGLAVAGDFAFLVGTEARRVPLAPFGAGISLRGLSLDAVVTANENEAYAVGPGGKLVWFRDGTWADRGQIADVDLHGITRTPAGELIAVGDAGRIVTSVDAVTWTPVGDSGTTVTLRAVWAGATSVFAVGEGGTIVRRGDDGAWTAMRSRTTQHLSAIHGLGESDLVAVGDDTVVRFDGTEWTGIRPPDPGVELTSVWVTAKYVYVGSTSAAFVLRRTN
ncbi:MAG TPA: hypothetical protein VIU61_29955 [Kofleriaceae bacterium]